jgi:3-oxoacyl-[acyl-carrier-protein] synthase-1
MKRSGSRSGNAYHPQAEVLAVGMTTAVGLHARAAAAAIRAGINKAREKSSIRNKRRRRQVMALVADEYLPPLVPALEHVGMSDANARMLQLAGGALAQAVALCGEVMPPLLLALPEVRPDFPDMIHPGLVTQLATQAGVRLDLRASRIYRQGGAGGLIALSEALALLAAEKAPYVVVGGVDTFLDLARLGALDGEDRLHGSSKDGFIPGEGAAFLFLGSRALRRRLKLPPVARVTGVGLGVEKGHRYSPEPYRGDGLAQAFRALFDGLPADAPKVSCVYAGFNGESMPAKEWGVAQIRNSKRFAEDVSVEHPADCVGDTGAALGPLMVALAAMGIRDGYRKEPCLVWSTSDREARAAAMVRTVVA